MAAATPSALMKTHLLLLCALTSIAALADQITLKNGDRISGKVVKLTAKT
jgi:hypothetical protein